MNITSSSDLTLDEMTDASDRIYQEVGDDAEIIWGQTFDEELGDEIRITVIATGIGQDEPALAENMHRFDPNPAQAHMANRPAYAPAAPAAASAAAQAYSAPAANSVPPQASPRQEPIARGIVRDATEEDLANWNEFDAPVVRVTTKRAVGDENLSQDYGMSFDHDDLEVPTFLRRKAD